MIKYSLICHDRHEFEAWFQSSAAYDKQSAKAQVACPHCGSVKVDKAIMAPAIAKRASGEPATAPQAKPLPASEQYRHLRQLRDEIHSKAEYVGGLFAEEARKIHFNESEPRGVYGEASAEEVKELAEDGVPFFPVPRLPEDLN
jgi:hypothetical protein